MSTKTLTLESAVSVQEMRQIAGGDSDVNSQNGRTTRVSVVTLNPVVSPDGTGVFVTVVYEVQEGSSNNTHLRGEQTVAFQVQPGARLVQVGPGGMNANYNAVFRGKDHGSHDISSQSGIAGTYLQTCSVKFDDKGDDDHGNANLNGHMQLPVTVEIEDQRPNLPQGGQVTTRTLPRFPVHLMANGFA